ncbi:MAG: phage antirepressor KilAC domain-containing protein [Lachnospiraceae bacterium]|nr:phage antirepressor KilAC domain-containing protein [Lachnospiraceae bacterium]
MNNLQVFNNEQFGQVRLCFDENNDVWFCGRDVLDALCYSLTSSIQSAFGAVPDLWKANKRMATPGGEQNMLCLSEQGLYFFLGRSDKPKALQYQMYIANEVMPSIRKHGMYATDEVIDKILEDPEFGIKLLIEYKAAKEKIAELKPKADYFDELGDRNLLTGITETAKEFGIGLKKFTNYLIDKGYCFRDKKKRLQPCMKYVENGLFALKECKNEANGWAGTQLMITPKGRETLKLLIGKVTA